MIGNQFLEVPSSLIHALIILARNTKYFSHACFVAFKIAKIQPERLSDITTLILPWLPQTGASVQQRTSLVKQLFEEDSSLAWNLLVSLLPNQTRSSFTIDEPKYLSIQWKNPSSIPDTYKEETSQYISLACEFSANDVSRLLSLVRLLDDVSHIDLLQILKTIENSAAQIDDEGKYTLWNGLLSLANRHHQFSSENWALPESSLAEIESTACLIMPTDKRLQIRRLFQNHSAYILQKHFDNYAEENQEISFLRSKALTWCIRTYGLDETLHCIENFDSISSVGSILAESNYVGLCDTHILEWINSKNEKLIAISKEYIVHRFFSCGMEWAKAQICSLSLPEQAKFLTLLPITKDVLAYISSLGSGDIEKIYWESVTLYYISDSELQQQIASSLIKYNRPWDAVELTHHLCKEGNPPSCESIFGLLEQMVICKSPANLQFVDYHTAALIGYLQKHWNDENKIALVEWQYYRLLEDSESSQPEALYRVLGRNPQAFMNLICLLYKRHHDKQRVLPAEKENLIAHAFNILRHWNTFPWIKKDGTADVDAFKSWYTEVKRISLEKDRYGVTLSTVGSILYYAPADSNGLFIDKNIAEILHKEDNDSIRDGYHTAAINSRGVHFVDHSGKEEFALEQKYNEQARQIDDLGYFRFAEVLREIAEGYHWEALGNIEEGKKWQEKDES